MVDASGNPRITDFGLATIARDPSSFPGDPDGQGYTPRWTAPEILQFGKTATKESDIFSFGMVIIEVGGDRSTIRRSPNPLTEVFTGEVPFNGIVASAAMKSIMDGGRPMRPDHPDLTESLWMLTRRCWAKEARDRPKMREVIKELKELLAVILRLYGELFAHALSQKHPSSRQNPNTAGSATCGPFNGGFARVKHSRHGS